MLTPVTVLGTDSKVKTLLPAERLRPQPVQGKEFLENRSHKLHFGRRYVMVDEYSNIMTLPPRLMV